MVTRAGVSGNAWASIWLPALLDGRGTTPSCGSRRSATPASCSASSWSSGRPGATRSPTTTTRCSPSWPARSGLALHNVRARRGAADHPRRGAPAGRRAAGIPGPHRGQRRRRAPPGRAQPARRGPAAPGGPGRQPAAGPRHHRRRPGRRDRDARPAGRGRPGRPIQELRELAHGIYPPLLVDRGLAEALRAAAGRAAAPGHGVAPTGIGRYPQEVEAAVYFCCLEALQNAGKHAPEATVRLRLWEESGGLLFSVSDNGPGFDAGPGARRPRLRQHVRPARRDRRHGPLGVTARPGHHDRRLGPHPVRRPLRPAEARELRCWRRFPSPAPPTAAAASPRRTAPC